MKVVVLGIPLPKGDNRWKDDLCQGGTEIGWNVRHIPARDTPVSTVLEACKGADLFIWAMTHGHNPKPPSSTEAMLRELEARGTRTVALHMDLYWGVPSRDRKIGKTPWWSCQYVFTADGGHQREFFQRGVNHFWMPPAMGSDYSYRGIPEPEPMKALFVGGYVPAIHGPDRGELLDWARGKYGSGFKVYGRAQDAVRQVYGDKLNDLYASAGVVLGDSAPSDYYWSDRVPCTLGRGGLLAHPYTPGFEDQGFTDDVMITYPRGDLEALAEKVDSITDSDWAERTANAIDLVRRRHLWKHRMRDLQTIVFNEGNCYCKRTTTARKLGGCWCS